MRSDPKEGPFVTSQTEPQPPRADGDERASRVKALGLALGFDLVGIASPAVGRDTEFFREWIARGYAGEMGYLERREDERVDPAWLLPGVRSIVVVGLAYLPRTKPRTKPRTGPRTAPRTGPKPGPGSEPPAPAVDEVALGRVASYAGGEDYHDVVKDRLRALATGIEALEGGPLEGRVYVDTGPVLERVFAARAGLGWIGKNTCLIHPKLGSRIFLGVLLSELPMPPDMPETDHCGRCRACLDACPTEAFAEPYVLDATRCLSYTTIEQRGPIDPALREGQGAHVFGCDICMDVCPWNRKPDAGPLPDPLGLRSRIASREEWRAPSLAWILTLDDDAFAAASRGTALRRSKRRGLIRNALVAAGNAGDPKLRGLIEQHARGDDALLAEHAEWALARLCDLGL